MKNIIRKDRGESKQTEKLREENDKDGQSIFYSGHEREGQEGQTTT